MSATRARRKTTAGTASMGAGGAASQPAERPVGASGVRVSPGPSGAAAAPPLTQADVVDALERVQRAIRTHYDALRDACTTEEQRQRLRAFDDAARDAYWAAVNAALRDFNAAVQQLYAELQTETAALERELASLKDIVATLRLLTEVVKIGAAIVTLAA